MILLTERREVAAEFAGRDIVIAEGEQVLTGRREFLHAPQRGLGREQVSLAIDRQKGWPGEKCLGVWVAAKFSGLKSLASPLGQKLSLRVEDLNAAIALVGDIDSAVANRDSARQVELSISLAEFSPFAERLAGGAKDGNLVPFSLLIVFRRWNAAVGDIDVSVVHRVRFRLGTARQRRRRRNFPSARELLHTGVVEIRDQDLIGGIDGDADRKIEFARLSSLSSPLQQKATRSRCRRLALRHTSALWRRSTGRP